MSRMHMAFLIRCWRWGGTDAEAEQRITIEHIPSGVRTRVESLEDAFSWVRRQWDVAASAGSPLGSPASSHPANVPPTEAPEGESQEGR